MNVGVFIFYKKYYDNSNVKAFVLNVLIHICEFNYPMKWLHSFYSRNTETIILQIFLLSCIPAILTNTLFQTYLFPGSVNFFWQSIDITYVRIVLSTALFFALLIVVLTKKWQLLYATIPLLLLVCLPSDRIGPAQGYKEHSTAFTKPENFKKSEEEKLLETYEKTIFWDIGGANLLSQKSHSLLWLNKKLAVAELAVKEWKTINEEYEQNLDEAKRHEDLVENYQAKIEALREIPSDVPYEKRIGKIGHLDIEKIKEKIASLRVKSPELAKKYNTAQIAIIDFQSNLLQAQKNKLENKTFYLNLPYTLAATGFIFFILFHFGFRNCYIATVLSCSLVLSFWTSFKPWSEYGWGYLLVSLYPIAIAFLSFMAVRFFIRIGLDNYEFLNQTLPRKKLFQKIAISLVLWVPFIAILWSTFLVSNYIQKTIVDAVYCQPMSQKECAIPEKAIVQNSVKDRDTLRSDLHVAIDKLYAQFEIQAIAAAGDINQATGPILAKTIDNVMGVFNLVIKPNLWNYDENILKKCRGFLDVKCYINNMIVRAINSAYRSPRDSLENRIHKRLKTAAELALKTGKKGNAIFKEAISGEARRAAKETKKQSDLILIGTSVGSVLHYTLVFFIALKALMVIFARQIFSRDKSQTILYSTLIPTCKEQKQKWESLIWISEESHLQFIIPKDHIVYVKQNQDPENAAPKTSLIPPFPLQWLFARLFNGCIRLKQVTPNVENQPIELTTTGGAQFVIWNVAKGEEIIFDWNNFIGVSHSAKLKKVISCKLGSFVLGRLILPSVEGPCILLQKTHGKAKYIGGLKELASVQPYRLLSWEKDTQFNIFSENGLFNTYIDHCQIDPQKRGRVILDASNENKFRMGVIGELFKLFKF